MSEVEELVGWLGEFVSNPWLVVADRQRLERILATITRLSEENEMLFALLNEASVYVEGFGDLDQSLRTRIDAALTQGESSRGKL